MIGKSQREKLTHKGKDKGAHVFPLLSICPFSSGPRIHLISNGISCNVNTGLEDTVIAIRNLLYT